MPPRSDQLEFEASAYLQTLIGRELFRSEELAIVELVKNAYDSGATRVVIRVRPPSLKEPGEIEIHDDGSGMTLEEFRRLFMFAGYSERPAEAQAGGRVPTGEKGIGRFASDRLGERLLVLTKTSSDPKGLRVEIDWGKFKNRRKRFHDITVPYSEEPIPGFPPSGSGTILRITGLREPWSGKQLESLRHSLAQLLDPYHRPADFEIDVQVQGSEVLTGPIRQEPISRSDADMEISFRVNSEGLVERRRRGRRYPMEQRETMHPSVDAAPLSGLQGRFFYFIVRPTRQQSKGLLPGVRVYRDGFRIEPFGSERADWLGVAEKRAKRAGHAHIVPSRLFGFVTISRKEHPDLKDTTSREALVDTGAARALVNVLREQLNFLESSIQTDIAQPRWDESRRRKVTEFERAKLQTLSIMSLGLAHELRQPLQSIRTEAAVITKRLKQLAIDDPYIASAQKNIDQSIERIDGNIRLIAAISAGSTDDVCAVDLAKVLSDECQLFKTRCAALGISLDTELPAEQWAELNSTTVTAILINLLQNAIDAFTEVRDDRSRRILVSVTKQDRTNRIEVSDNAYGIPPQVQGSIFKRFASKKTGGWGVGLYNCQLMARAHGGEISFETRDRLGTTFRVKLPDVTSTNARPNPDSR